MDWLWFDNKFLGVDWHLWKIVGWFGNVAFFSRFMVQWYASEKHKRVVVPVAFWWLSIVGSLILLSYASFYRRDSVFIFAYAFTWIPYVRNLVLHYRHQEALMKCPSCAALGQPGSKFCSQCGASMEAPDRGHA